MRLGAGVEGCRQVSQNAKRKTQSVRREVQPARREVWDWMDLMQTENIQLIE